MATSKKGGTAKVSLDAATASKLTTTLRQGLSDSAAYLCSNAAVPPGKAGPVELDPDKVAEFVNHLHDRMCAAGAISEDDRDNLTPVPAKAARKSSAKKTRKK